MPQEKQDEESKEYTASCQTWDFRSNKDMHSKDEIIKFLKDNCSKWVFQLEKGEENGYEHWQGRFRLHKRKRKSELKAIMKTANFKWPNYFRPTVCENHESKRFSYVLKIDTKIDGPWADTDHLSSISQIRIPRQYRDLEMWPWQQQILDSIDIFEPRKINYIYDKEGNKGKSTVAALAELMYGAINMPNVNDGEKLLASLCNICMDTNNYTPKCVLFDLPRSLSKDRLYGMYSAFEEIKKGKLVDMRYHYTCFWIDSPQIWIFSNDLPQTKLLSSDRWLVWKIEDLKLVRFEYQEEITDEKTTNPLDC